MNYRNIDDLNHCILQHLSILPRDFDLIVGETSFGILFIQKGLCAFVYAEDDSYIILS